MLTLTMIVAVLGLVLAAAGCGTATSVRHVDRVPRADAALPALPALPHDPCADSPAAGRPAASSRWKRESVPAGFKPVLLLTCTWEDRTSASTGEWTYRVEKRAVDHLDAVVTALRSTPPPPPTGSYACAAVAIADPWFLLVDSGGLVVLPVVPRERACGQPIDVGLKQLHYTTVSASRVRQQSTPAELATGCTGAWKNEPRIAVAMHNSHSATARRTVSAKPTSVCTYASGGSEIGHFRGGTRLSSGQSARIARLLTGGAARPQDSCRIAGDFALIQTDSGGWFYVELSGCHRLFLDEGSTFTAPVPGLVAAIRSLSLRR